MDTNGHKPDGLELQIVVGPEAYAVLAAVLVVDAWLLYRFFKYQRPADAPTRARTL